MNLGRPPANPYERAPGVTVPGASLRIVASRECELCSLLCRALRDVLHRVVA